MKTYQFQAEILKVEDMDAAYITFPYNVFEEFGVKGQVKVKAVFDNKIEYRGSLAKMGLDCHCLGMTKKVRSQLGKMPGDVVVVDLKADDEPRIVDVPEDVTMQLKSTGLEESFKRLSYTKQKEYMVSIMSAKKPETRNKRITELMESLKRSE